MLFLLYLLNVVGSETDVRAGRVSVVAELSSRAMYLPGRRNCIFKTRFEWLPSTRASKEFLAWAD